MRECLTDETENAQGQRLTVEGLEKLFPTLA